MKKHIVLSIMILVIATLLISCSSAAPEPEPEPVNDPAILEPKPVTYDLNSTFYNIIPKGVSPLTGLPYEGDGRAIMVQLENTPMARPHSGITQADLLYEIEVESEITRLTTFFLSSYPEKVGPVRSARKQHIYLWKEWDYPYVFYGGSNSIPGQIIYEIMKQLGTTAPYLDGTKTSVSFTRASDRSAPHNAYTNLKFIIENAYDYTPRQRSLYFDKDEVLEGSPANEISFSYRSDNNVKYVYNSETQKFDRSINGTPMMDAENDQQLAVKNIIIQHANHFKVKGTPYTNIDLVGSGAAEYFTDGIMRTGTWERKSKDSLTVYFDVNGKEISFSPGVTFIQIVRTNTPVNVQ